MFKLAKDLKYNNLGVNNNLIIPNFDPLDTSFKIGEISLDPVTGEFFGFDGIQWKLLNGGFQGSQGPQGSQGAQGLPGGPIGVQGIIGIQGNQGAQGSDIGNQGAQGAQGAQGIQGPQGSGPGFQGPPGNTGNQGIQGPQGVQGAPGSNGNPGALGAQGPAGPPGETGPIGPTNLSGPQGEAGFQGAQGVQGSTGPIGNGSIQIFNWNLNPVDLQYNTSSNSVVDVIDISRGGWYAIPYKDTGAIGYKQGFVGSFYYRFAFSTPPVGPDPTFYYFDIPNPSPLVLTFMMNIVTGHRVNPLSNNLYTGSGREFRGGYARVVPNILTNIIRVYFELDQIPDAGAEYIITCYTSYFPAIL